MCMGSYSPATESLTRNTSTCRREYIYPQLTVWVPTVVEEHALPPAVSLRDANAVAGLSGDAVTFRSAEGIARPTDTIVPGRAAEVHSAQLEEGSFLAFAVDGRGGSHLRPLLPRGGGIRGRER